MILREFEYDGMEIIRIVCNNYECNWGIQINFGREIEIVYVDTKK